MGKLKLRKFMWIFHSHRAGDWRAKVQSQVDPIPEPLCLSKKNKQTQMCKSVRHKRLSIHCSGWRMAESGRNWAGKVKGQIGCSKHCGLYTVAKGNQWRFPSRDYSDQSFILDFRLWIMSYMTQSEIIEFESPKSLALPLNKKVCLGSK